MMKRITATAVLCIIASMQCLKAQIKNLQGASNIIHDSLVKEKTIGGTKVKFVEEKYLKEGWNEINHKAGGFVYINYKSGKINSYYLSDSTGAVLAGMAQSVDVQQYEEKCMGVSCFCLADKNCAALFAANKEKTDIVCVGNSCFFTRPFDALAYKKEYLANQKAEAAVCTTNETTTLEFSGKAVFLSRKAMKKLDSLLSILANASCRIEVTAYDVNCMVCQQVSWDRTFSVYKYLHNKGIDSARFILRYEEGANPQVVTIRQNVDWDYPVLPMPPMPCYSYHRLTKKRCKGSH